MPNVKKIGIALAFYNPEKELFLGQLKSILNQSFINFSLVITVDEDSHNVLENGDIKELTDDSRVKIKINSSRKGYPGNFIEAIGECLKLEVDAIAFSDQDDIWDDKKLETLVSLLNKHSSACLVHSDSQIKYIETGKTVESMWEFENRKTVNDELSDVLVRNLCSGATSLIRSEVVRSGGPFPQNVSYHDHWYAVLARSKGKIIHCDKKLTIYNQHDENVLGTKKYHGVVSRSDLNNSFFKKAYSRYITTKNMALGLRSTTELPFAVNSMFVLKWDLGLLSFVKFIRFMLVDRALARAYLSFTIGKILYCIGYGAWKNEN